MEVKLDYPDPAGYKYRNLALQVERLKTVSIVISPEGH
jgi:hypothetical protein